MRLVSWTSFGLASALAAFPCGVAADEAPPPPKNGTTATEPGRPGTDLVEALLSRDPQARAAAERALASAPAATAAGVALTLRERLEALDRAVEASPIGAPLRFDPVPPDVAARATVGVEWRVRILEMSACEAHGWFGNPPCDGRAPVRILGDRGRERILAAAGAGRGTKVLATAGMLGLEGQRVTHESLQSRTFAASAAPAGAPGAAPRAVSDTVQEGVRVALQPWAFERGRAVRAQVDVRVGHVPKAISVFRTRGDVALEQPEWVGATVRRFVEVPDGGTFLLGGLGTCEGGSSIAILVTARVTDVPPARAPAPGR